MLNPQLPASAVVTPWNGEGVSAPSQKTWASKCVWTSMNPGVTTLPVEIYTSIRKGFTPEINAISTIIIFVSMGLMLIVARFYRFGGERSGNE